MNAIELSMCGCDAAFCQLILTTFLFLVRYLRLSLLSVSFFSVFFFLTISYTVHKSLLKLSLSATQFACSLCPEKLVGLLLCAS